MADIQQGTVQKEEQQEEADFITIVSSEMIADVMQDYFNKHMYKKKVVIVDLKPTETGYMFSLSFAVDKPPITTVQVEESRGFVNIYTQQTQNNGTVRDSKGKFTSGNSKQTVKG